MTVKHWLLVGISLLMLTGMRDPFKPPEDRCQTGELTMWRYQGAVSRGERTIGILQDSQQRWRRVEQHQVLDNGWTVTQLTTQTLTLITGENCDPPDWQWQRQGEVDEAMDSGTADGSHPRRPGGKDAKRDAGRG
ncbi:DUF2531 domain-containing protein [Citrobacter amalonaticus]|uniref:DUF2531 domain-containing protein n=1 Tax=Citrobacter amalonaticus TaxID=35703 RepID=A0A2S4RUL2_CITAM|nr:HofP DNA utilization family protein [Citrobacter amalonaticus]POT55410.1 DUF2531 domain-containing protein [Citrobacter amalonaticus]POT73621.1 DUF2531 domain-containing protein [Citrobacter amalonaticus]POU63845.1 DUF2531 domain-containing protein [Citrobacter amalonaticus]POV03479.1 DUF2531 domain-containing protein [Citrobacter amalonaticus]